MNQQDKIRLMTERFVHEDGPFAEQVWMKDKNKLLYVPVRTGECHHQPPHKIKSDCPSIRNVQFEDRHMFDHLKGKKTYASYQLKDGKVKWLCFDADGYGASDEDAQSFVRTIARNIVRKLGKNRCLVEDSGSKGYHIWVFFDQPTDVGKVFNLGHELVQTIQPPEGMNLEIYPKQVSSKVFGNTVKMPLGVHQKTGNRCLFVDSDFIPYSPEQQWERLSSVTPVSSQWVDQNVSSPTRSFSEPNKQDYVPRCISQILREGVGEGIRDEAAFRVSCYLREKGIPVEYAEIMLDNWNEKNSPPLDDVDLESKIEQGYSTEYSWMPCRNSSFDSFCHSDCYFWKRKVQKRWHTKETDPVGIISND